MLFEMRFDLGTLDSGERSLPFWLLVLLYAGCCYGNASGSIHSQILPFHKFIPETLLCMEKVHAYVHIFA